MTPDPSPADALAALAEVAARGRGAGPEARDVVLRHALALGQARSAWLCRREGDGLRWLGGRAREGALDELPPRLLARVAQAVREAQDGVVERPPPGQTGGAPPTGGVGVKAEAGAPPVHALPLLDPETGDWAGVLGLVPDPAAPVERPAHLDQALAALAALVAPGLLGPDASGVGRPAPRAPQPPGAAGDGEPGLYDELVTRSPRMEAIFKKLDRIASTDVPVLVCGETGTGKELIARALHRGHPARRKKRFYAQNCGAISESLLESELFGHERGAFTGADRRKKGLFEVASGSTLFLDEIGEMNLDMQTKLLRVLQEREVVPLGSSDPVPVDVRIVAATLRDLDADVAAGRFRQDLLYRLKVVKLDLPPLRDRPEDVPLLIDHFLQRHARQRGERPKVLDRRDERVLEAFVRHPWPGNVRQLENVITRLAYLAGDVITWEALVEDRQLLAEPEEAQGAHAFRPLDELVEELERREIEAALAQAKGNRTQAAALLHVNRRSLLRRLQKYGYAEGDAGDAEP